MEMEILRSFITTAEAGSITEAANRLHLSQPALSRRLQQLETELGAPLLVRGRHGVELTAVGQETLTEARAILGRYARLQRNITDQLRLERGVVRIGGGATAVSYLLPDAIASFQRQHPGIRFHVLEAGSHQVAEAVGDRTLDLGLVTLPVRMQHVITTALLRDEIVLVASANHPLASRASVHAAELEHQPLVAFETGSAIREVIDRALDRAGADVDIVMELRSVPSMLRLTAATGYLAFVSRLSIAAEPSLRVIPVRGLRITRDLGIAAHAEIPLAAQAAAFAEQLESTAPATARSSASA